MNFSIVLKGRFSTVHLALIANVNNLRDSISILLRFDNYYVGNVQVHA